MCVCACVCLVCAVCGGCSLRWRGWRVVEAAWEEVGRQTKRRTPYGPIKKCHASVVSEHLENISDTRLDYGVDMTRAQNTKEATRGVKLPFIFWTL